MRYLCSIILALGLASDYSDDDTIFDCSSTAESADSAMGYIHLRVPLLALLGELTKMSWVRALVGSLHTTGEVGSA